MFGIQNIVCDPLDLSDDCGIAFMRAMIAYQFYLVSIWKSALFFSGSVDIN